MGLRSGIDRLRGRADAQVKGLVGDSLLLGLGIGSQAIAYLVQIALITRRLGLAEFGRFSLIVAFGTLVQQFFDVRADQAAVVFGSRALRKDARSAAGVLQFCYLADLLTGVIGFIVLVALAGTVGPRLVGNGGERLLVLFAVTLLASTVDATSVAIMRVLDRYGLLLADSIGSAVLQVTIVAVALVRYHTLTALFIGLVVLDVATAIANVLLARAAFAKVSKGVSMFSPAMSGLGRERRDVLKMIFHTNVIGYARMAQVQLPTLVLGQLGTAVQVGVYKLGSAVVQGVGKLADPAFLAVLPRIARLGAANRVADIRRLIRQVSLISFPAMGAISLVIIRFREPLLRLAGGSDRAAAAGTVLVLLLIGQALGSAMFWNAPLLVAAHRAGTAARIHIASVVVLIPLLYLLGGRYGSTGVAEAVLVGVMMRNVLTTALALRLLSRERFLTDQPGAAEADELAATIGLDRPEEEL